MSFWLTLVNAIILAALTGFLIGLRSCAARRLSGNCYSRFWRNHSDLLKSDLLTSFTGGPKGVTNIPALPLCKTFSSDIDFMYLIIIAMAITIFVTYRCNIRGSGAPG
jgi:ABC-type branched-subunit amino acid transport system permease subunit